MVAQLLPKGLGYKDLAGDIDGTDWKLMPWIASSMPGRTPDTTFLHIRLTRHYCIRQRVSGW
ncbi:MAG: hypothetical protein H6573_24890 [Lewinellaceae bacterium]|nr:hypothetical protein [Lewinellaceae bacterium]